MRSYEFIQKPSMIVVGIECRTSNAPESGPRDISSLWERFYSEDIANQIPNKISNEVFALYCDYEGDYTQPYSLVIGCLVSSLDVVPSGMVGKVIPAGSYACFHAVGEYPASLIKTWKHIWQQEGLKRTYTGDYEVYGKGSPEQVHVFIAVESQIKQIVVTPYNLAWPKLFEIEALKVQETLGANCLAIHHIGSTSIPGLSAKPIIDMIGVVKNPEKAIQALENLGFKYKGEYNIPMRYYFSQTGDVDIHLHVYEEGHPEIELNLLFRDYLRDHPEATWEYETLKKSLLKEKSSYEKDNSPFTRYNLGKDAFIRKILKAAHYDRIRMVKCAHHVEWDFVKKIRQKHFFDPLSIIDPYTWTFNHKDHAHLILYHGVEMIGYAHIQLWPDRRAALRIFVVEEDYRSHGLGSQFLHLCEQWLKKLGIKSLHDEVRLDAVKFYRKNGYSEMLFNDPSGEEPSAQDLAMGKVL